jgi:beta-lactamase regulating signal transducer with metallopeptidase domain
MNALESNLTAFLFKTTLILVAALAAHVGLRKASAATRHLCLTLAMVALVVLPFLSFSLPAWQLEVLPHAAASAMPASAPAPVTLEQAWPEGESTAVASAAPGPQARPQPSPVVASKPAASPMSLGSWLFLAWAVGAGLALVKLLAGLLRVRFMVRDGARVTEPGILRLLDECGGVLNLGVRPLLVSSESVGVPMVAGWLRPVMIVPREFFDWRPDRMRSVVLHELGHLKRNDWPILVLGRVVASLYWFHPLAWSLERCAKRDCERACDDLVVSCGTKPSDYATHLLSIARSITDRPEPVRAALAVVRRSQLTGRLRSILDPLHRRNAPTRTAVAGMSTALMLVLLPLASLQFAEKAHAKESDPPPEILLAQHTEMTERKEWHHDEEATEGKRAYERGYEQHQKGRYEEAAAAFEKAKDLGFRPGTSMYNAACCYALMGDADASMGWLDRAFEAGFDDPENLVNDSDFDPIRSDAQFQAFVDRAFEAAGIERTAPQHYPYRSTLEYFDELKASGSTDGETWHKVGYKLIGLRELDLAVEAFEFSVQYSGEHSSTSMYNLACALSLAGKSRPALEWLDRSVEAGFTQHERFLNDTDLDNLRDEKEFARIREKSEFLALGRFPRRSWDTSDYSEDRWAPAVTEYERYTREHPSSGRAWFNLGFALHYSSRHAEAVDAFQKAAELNFRPTTATYNIACAHAMLDNTEAALDALEIAVGSGDFHFGQLEGDDDLDNLRDEPRFQALLEELAAKQRECEHEEKLKIKMKMKTKSGQRADERRIEASKEQEAALAAYNEARDLYFESKDD